MMAGSPIRLHVVAAAFAIVTAIANVSAQQLVTAARDATTATPADSPRRLDALLAEAQVLLRYDLDEAVRRADEAALLADRTSDPFDRARAFAIKATAAISTVGPTEAEQLLVTAERLLGRTAPDAARAPVALARALVSNLRDRQDDCLTALQAAIDAAEAADDHATLCRASLLSIAIVGWPEDAVSEARRIQRLAKQSGLAGLQLQGETYLVNAMEQVGQIPDVRPECERLLLEARRLGDRSSEAYLSATLAIRHTADDLDRTHAYALDALQLYRLQGNRGQIANSLHYLGMLSVHRQTPVEGLVYCEQALAEIEGLARPKSEKEFLETAIRIASLVGEADKAQRLGERHAALVRELARTMPPDQRGALWRQALALRRDLREQRAIHADALAAIEDSRNRAVLIGALAMSLLLVLTSFLLLRSRRRLLAMNDRLQQSLDDSENLQEERTALQHNMQQIERLDSLGLLAGGFAHDFNNILVGVRGNAQLLQEAPDLPDRSKMLAEIVHASERAANLCRDILSYAHSAPTEKETLDVRDVLEAVMPLARSGLGAGVTLTTDLGDRPARVFANRSQIEQVFLNILINAGDAIADHGRIAVTVDRARLDGKPPSGNWFGEFTGKPVDCIAVTVLDNGQGMDAQTVRRIFDPFFTTRFAGRGLGLAAVFGILRRHDGIVEVQSEPDQGTQFTIYLPHHVADPEPAERAVEIPSTPPRTDAPALRSLVLVVDDEPSVCEVARAALAVDGHGVLTATDYQTALDVIERRGADVNVALVDVTMPDIDGPKLAHLLTAKCPHLRIIMMTGHAEAHVHLNDIEAPLLTKPFDLTHLRRAVQDRLATDAN